MAKLILSLDSVILKEVSLDRERMTIGRKAQNDIQIDNLAVSGEHAVIISLLSDAFLEDLNSTNGTYVNGRPVKKHFLQNGDVIELAKYRLKFVSDAAVQAEAKAQENSVAPRAETLPGTPGGAAFSPLASTARSAPPAVPQATLHILTGANAGKEIGLAKPVTTLGKPGVLVAAIAREPSGYYITHVEGEPRPRIGSRVLVDSRPYPLLDHDVLELGGVKMVFCLH